jgi:hypothetical protein
MFNSTKIQHLVSISAPSHTRHLISPARSLCSLPLHVEYWIKDALALHEKSACHFYFTSSHTPSVLSLPDFLFVVSLYTKYYIKCVFTSKSPIFSLNKLWAWSFRHRHAYQHCRFSSFSTVHFWNNEHDFTLERSILFFMAEWGATMHEPCYLFNSTKIQLPVSFQLPSHSTRLISPTCFIFVLRLSALSIESKVH